jgi:hypothetical protein
VHDVVAQRLLHLAGLAQGVGAVVQQQWLVRHDTQGLGEVDHRQGRAAGHGVGGGARVQGACMARRPAQEGREIGDAAIELAHVHQPDAAHQPRRRLVGVEVQRRREVVSFFGQDEHPYFYLGQRRIARLLMVDLDDPAAARDAWRTYADRWTRSIHRDDAWFYAACASARLGDLSAARADLARIAQERPESRHLARADLALSDPRGPHCTPPEVTR